jgi:SH3-like domain-containing protein
MIGWITEDFVTVTADQEPSTALIVSDAIYEVRVSTEVHSGPDDSFPVIQTLSTGSQVSIVASSNDWYRIRLANGSYGWLRLMDLPSLESRSATTATAIVNVASANLRSGPGTNYSVVGTALQSESFQIMAQSEDRNWLLIVVQNGRMVWIARAIVDVAPEEASIALATSAVPTAESSDSVIQDVSGVIASFREAYPATDPNSIYQPTVYVDFSLASTTIVRISCVNSVSENQFYSQLRILGPGQVLAGTNNAPNPGAGDFGPTFEAQLSSGNYRLEATIYRSIVAGEMACIVARIPEIDPRYTVNNR